MAQNCWENKKCGRQPGGARVAELGVCVAATERRLQGVNDGTAGGRACWAISGTLCGGKVQGSFAAKLPSCMSCDFYKSVALAQGAKLVNTSAIHDRLR